MYCVSSADRSVFRVHGKKPKAGIPKKKLVLDFTKELVREDELCRYMKEIHQMAVSGKSISVTMGTAMPMPRWDDILILGVRPDPMSLDEKELVHNTVTIGKHAKNRLFLKIRFIYHICLSKLSQKRRKCLLPAVLPWLTV